MDRRLGDPLNGGGNSDTKEKGPGVTGAKGLV